jgi:hypothetical protein
MLSFKEWLVEEAKKPKKKRRIKMSNQLVKEVQKSGMSITKDRLLDLIKKSHQQSFIISLNPNSKQTVVVIPSA